MKILKFRNDIAYNNIDGNLALKTNYPNNEEKTMSNVKTYEKPMVKKLVLETPKKKNNRIFMGCYAYSWPANDGDGC